VASGGLIVDKPEGWTSHDVVARVRRLAGTRRVGHTGTLDPFATGVLVVCVGAATRLSQLLVGCEKQYEAVMRLGWATDTQDHTGERIGDVAASDVIPDDAALLRRVLEEFSGEIEQLPPMFSAKKVGGEVLYKHARAGREVERRTVRVQTQLDLAGPVERNDDGTVDVPVRVTCSAGTYVRTLAHDVGARIGCGAHLVALRRTRVGPFGIELASTLDALEGRVAERLVAPADLVAELAPATVGDDDVRRVRQGQAVSAALLSAPAADGADVRVLDGAGALVAIARLDAASGLLRPRVVLPDGA
jgi:tRNA pseudouridine55 synthase